LLGEGIDAVWAVVEEFMAAARASSALTHRRGEQARDWMWSEVSETLLDRLRADDRVHADLGELEADVVAGRVSPTAAARLLLDRFSG
jgi:LAO/AO transport system kinase